MTSTDTKALLSEGAARAIAYDWHGGQWSGLYSFASTGRPTSRDLDRAITEVSTDLGTLSRDHTEFRRVRNLLAYLEQERAQRPDTEEGDGDE